MKEAQNLLLNGLILSLKITAIYFLFLQGNVLGWLGIWVENIKDKYCPNLVGEMVLKPFFTCLPCMASAWTIILTQSIQIELIFVVCGINVLIDKLLGYAGDH